MSLRIILYRDSPSPYVVGSTVSGHIELDVKNATQRDSIDQINLYFSCRSKICINRVRGTGNDRRTHHYPSKAVLFSHSYVLENKDFKIASSRRGEDGGTLKFPFQFVIPTHAEGLAPEKQKLHSADLFSADGLWPGSVGYDDSSALSQSLPDSLEDFHHVVTGRLSFDGGITYKVRAEVPKKNTGWHGLSIGHKDQHVYLPVVNPDPGPKAQAQVQWHSLSFKQSVRTLRLLPSHADGHLTFRERTRSFFKPNELPCLDLVLTFTVPQTLFLDSPDDDPLPFFLAVARTPPASRDTIQQYQLYLDQKANRVSKPTVEHNIPTPTVYLTRMSVILVTHTQVRSSGGPGSAASFIEHGIFEYRYHEKESGGAKIELPLFDPSASSSSSGGKTGGGPQQWDVGRALGVTHCMLKELGERENLKRDFATPNLAMGKLLQWEIRVEVAGEEITWKSEKHKDGRLCVRIE